MLPKNAATQNIDDFISTFPKDVQDILQKIRKTIHEAAPEAVETISYGIPTFDLHGSHLVHFAGAKHHIGFYPTSSGIEKFKSELSAYKLSRGTVQFPLDKPIPYELIRRITLFRVTETLERAAAKGKKKK
jgi:uncharacterized protein YdhG (YjbR/CyaY superfamily)